MSPYLFFMCMEKLALLIQQKVDSRLWQPIQITRSDPLISYLFFVDCLLFVKAKCNQVRLVKEVLDHFCKAFGLKINIHKSIIMPSKNISRRKVSKLSSII